MAWNVSGNYLFVDMSKVKHLGATAIVESDFFYPPPKFHSNIHSPYFNSCQVSVLLICSRLGVIKQIHSLPSKHSTQISSDRYIILWEDTCTCCHTKRVLDLFMTHNKNLPCAVISWKYVG